MLPLYLHRPCHRCHWAGIHGDSNTGTSRTRWHTPDCMGCSHIRSDLEKRLSQSNMNFWKQLYHVLRNMYKVNSCMHSYTLSLDVSWFLRMCLHRTDGGGYKRMCFSKGNNLKWGFVNKKAQVTTQGSLVYMVNLQSGLRNSLVPCTRF